MLLCLLLRDVYIHEYFFSKSYLRVFSSTLPLSKLPATILSSAPIKIQAVKISIIHVKGISARAGQWAPLPEPKKAETRYKTDWDRARLSVDSRASTPNIATGLARSCVLTSGGGTRTVRTDGLNAARCTVVGAA